MDRTAPLDAAAALHAELREAEARTNEIRARRDAAVREAITGGPIHEAVTMYAIAKRLDIPEQSVRRIRDRAPTRDEILESQQAMVDASTAAIPELHRQQGETGRRPRA